METYWEAKEKGFGEEDLKWVLKAVAGVFAYTTQKDVNGVTYELSDDPIRDTLLKCGQDALAGVPSAEAFKPLIEDKSIMGKELDDETKANLLAIVDELIAKIK